VESFLSWHALSEERSNAACNSFDGGPLCLLLSSLRYSWKESSPDYSSSGGGDGGDGVGMDGGGGGGDGGVVAEGEVGMAAVHR
jgi:hypothetical protein